MLRSLVLCVAALTLVSAAKFRWAVRTETCDDTTQYMYTYDSTEKYFEDQVEQTSQMQFDFGILCLMDGDYEGDSATLYNVTNVTATAADGDVITLVKEDGADVNETIDDLNIALDRFWFTFVLLTDGPRAGSIPATYYDTNEVDEIVNIKKTLAANFQSKQNFTSNTAIEVDPQSAHRSTYTVTSQILENEAFITQTTTQTRVVQDSDVGAFSAAVPNEEINYYRADTLRMSSTNQLLDSSGNVTMRLIPPSDTMYGLRSEIPPEELVLQDSVRAKLYKRETNSSQYSNDDIIYDPTIVTNYYKATGKYGLKLTGSKKVAKRSILKQEIDLSNAVESTLLATINYTRSALRFMSELRAGLGDINDVLEKLQTNPKKYDLASKIETLVKMEAKYGTTPSHTPAVDDVIDYLHSLIGSKTLGNINTRLLLYYILSPEGSLPAQMAIVESLENAVDEEEEENVLFYLAFMENPQPQTVARVEQLISDDRPNDPVLLAYSAMVPRASPQLQQRMTSFLFDRLPMAELQKKTLINHILALGNTESLSTKDYIINYLNNPDKAIQLTAIFALRSLLNDTSVQTSLKQILMDPQTPVSHVTMIARALMHGADYAKFKRQPSPFPNSLVYLLVARASGIDDEETHSTISRYLKGINTNESLDILEFMNALKSSDYEAMNVTRARRGTKWDEANSVYDLVAPLSERQADVKNFPHHLSYIWGKKFGCKDINLQFAAGGFVGAADSREYKVFGRAVAQATVYNRHTNFIEFTVLRLKTNKETHITLYGFLMGKTLVNIDYVDDPESCKTFSKPLYEGKIYTIFDFKYRIFIYIGFLNFGVKATAQFNAGLELALCEGVGKASAGVYLTPGITFVVSAYAEAELVLLVKGGLTVDVSITYQLQPGANTELCWKTNVLTLKNCIGIYDQWKDSHIDLYAWYAWRGWCGWWLCTGNKAYRNKHKVPGLSWTWKLFKSNRHTLYEVCDRDIDC